MKEPDIILSDMVVLVNNYRMLERRCEELEHCVVNAAMFYNWAVDVDTIASMHGVSKYIVRKYIEMGLIETHPNNSKSRFLVRGSTALTLNFKELREKAKKVKYSKL